MSSPSPRLRCPMCLQVTPAAVTLPCGHSFCQPCLRTLDRGLDRHCCPQCRREYHPLYYHCDGRCTESCNHAERPGSHANAIGNTGKSRSDDGERTGRDGEVEVEGGGSFDKDVPGRGGMGKTGGGIMYNNHQSLIFNPREMGNASFCQGTGGFQGKAQSADEKTRQEGSGGSGFLNKSSLSADSELYDYLKSKMVESDGNLAANVEEKMTRGEDLEGGGGFQNNTPLLKSETQNDCSENNNVKEMRKATDGEIEDSAVKKGCGFQNITTRGTEGDTGSRETLALQNKSPVSEEDERKMAESKLKLASQVVDLALELEKAESLLEAEQQRELTVTTANAKLREHASRLVGDVTSFARDFSEQVMKLMEREFSPGEAVVRDRVGDASARTEQIKKAMEDAANLLREEDSRVFTSKIPSVALGIEKCKAVKQPGGGGRQEVQCDLAKLCPELERLSGEFRDKLGQVQRSLRNVFNPSEVTFDPETLHPNLVLSEDMKTVRFSAKKQQCTPSPKRFATFFQVLSTQSFGAGVHRWEVELEGAPWMLGVCAASALPRAGLPSALETCPTSWVLMWTNNALTAFERCRAVPLKKTSEASRRLRVELDWDTRALAFHHLGLSGSCLIHRFTLDTEEPLHLAYRMLSGDPKGRATICS